MKLLVLACLAALALAREKEELSVATEASESLSSSEESIICINKNKCQDKTSSFIPQPLVYPNSEPVPYANFPQSILPAAQPAMVPAFLPVVSPEIVEMLKAKDTILALPKHKPMAFPKSSTGLFVFDPQVPSLTNLENHPLPGLQLQPLGHQLPSQRFLQTLVLSAQPQLSPPQSKALPVLQQVVSSPPRYIHAQDLLQYQNLLLDPTHHFPVTQPLGQIDPFVV